MGNAAGEDRVVVLLAELTIRTRHLLLIFRRCDRATVTHFPLMIFFVFVMGAVEPGLIFITMAALR